MQPHVGTLPGFPWQVGEIAVWVAAPKFSQSFDLHATILTPSAAPPSSSAGYAPRRDQIVESLTSVKLLPKMSQPGLVGGDMRRWPRRPRLRIEFELSRDVSRCNSSDTGWTRRFATVHVRNTGKDTAKRCVATVRVLSAPPEVELRQSEWTVHWAGVDYSGQTTGAEPVEIGH